MKKVNIIELDSNVNKVILTGDWHLGHHTVNETDIKKIIAYCLSNGYRIHLMGDLIEHATKSSVGAGVHEQIKQPQEQIDTLTELLKPLARAKLITGIHRGNHEARAFKGTGIDIIANLCRELVVPYLWEAGWTVFKYPGRKTYSFYTFHGTTCAATKGGKIEYLARKTNYIDADVVACGHGHDLFNEELVKKYVYADKVQEKITHIGMTGSLLGYDDSYAEPRYSPNQMGFLEVTMVTHVHRVEIKRMKVEEI